MFSALAWGHQGVAAWPWACSSVQEKLPFEFAENNQDVENAAVKRS